MSAEDRTGDAPPGLARPGIAPATPAAIPTPPAALARRRQTSHLMQRMVMAVHRYTGRTAREMTMPVADVHAMGVLAAADEPLTATELGRHLGLSRSAVSSLLYRLVREGFVRRSGSSSDGRRVMVEASDAAHEQSAAQFEELNRVVLRVLADNPDEAPAFVHVLDRLTEEFEKLDRA